MDLDCHHGQPVALLGAIFCTENRKRKNVQRTSWLRRQTQHGIFILQHQLQVSWKYSNAGLLQAIVDVTLSVWSIRTPSITSPLSLPLYCRFQVVISPHYRISSQNRGDQSGILGSHLQTPHTTGPPIVRRGKPDTKSHQESSAVGPEDPARTEIALWGKKMDGWSSSKRNDKTLSIPFV